MVSKKVRSLDTFEAVQFDGENLQGYAVPVKRAGPNLGYFYRLNMPHGRSATIEVGDWVIKHPSQYWEVVKDDELEHRFEVLND